MDRLKEVIESTAHLSLRYSKERKMHKIITIKLFSNPIQYAIIYMSLKEFNFLVGSHLLIPNLEIQYFERGN